MPVQRKWAMAEWGLLHLQPMASSTLWHVSPLCISGIGPSLFKLALIPTITSWWLQTAHLTMHVQRNIADSYNSDTTIYHPPSWHCSCRYQPDHMAVVTAAGPSASNFMPGWMPWKTPFTALEVLVAFSLCRSDMKESQRSILLG